MALDLSQFSEEQQREIVAELDRRANQASKTAREKADGEWEAKLPALVQSEVLKKQDDVMKTTEQRMQEEWKERFDVLETTMKNVTAERNKSMNEAKIRKSGITDDTTVERFSTMFAENPDELDGFLESFTSSVSAQVQQAQQAQLSNSTPPGTTTETPEIKGRALTQAETTKLIEDNKANNGGYIDQDALFVEYTKAQLK